MANNKMYANFLMHGRTKGSKNGISNTKGYTAVGKKAVGKLINGRYVYDYYTPYGTKPSTLMEGYTPLAAISTREQERQEQREKDDYKARLNKSMAETAARVKSENAAKKGAENNWQQQANQAASYTGYKTLSYKDRRNKQMAETAARIKAENAAKKGSNNNWQQNAAKASAAGIRNNTVNDIAAANKKQHYANILAKGAAMGTSQAAATAEISKKQAANAAAKGQNNNWQQQAAYQQQKEAARNRALAKGAANNWQTKANAARAMTEYGRKAEAASKAKANFDSSGTRKITKQLKSYVTPYISKEYQKEVTSSAMNNDPRYNAKGSEKIAQAKVTAAHKALVSSAEESKARNMLGGFGGLAGDIMDDKQKNTLQQKIIDTIKNPKKRKKKK